MRNGLKAESVRGMASSLRVRAGSTQAPLTAKLEFLQATELGRGGAVNPKRSFATNWKLPMVLSTESL